jgi:hypothetical protein
MLTLVVVVAILLAVAWRPLLRVVIALLAAALTLALAVGAIMIIQELHHVAH